MVHRDSSASKLTFAAGSTESSLLGQTLPLNVRAPPRAASTGRIRRTDEPMSRRPSLPQLLPRSAASRNTSVPPIRALQERCRFGQVASRSQAKQICVLRPGNTVRIGNQTFDITERLGAGSFGSVWAAKNAISEPVAVKEILCKSADALDVALKEREVLQSLAREVPPAIASQIPAVFAIEVIPTVLASCQVCLAMSRMPGVPICSFLESRNQADRTWGCTELLNVVAKACSTSRELLSQLAPAFEHISKLVYHRDINPANVMIDDQNGTPRFGIIDFGLATDSAKWRTDVLLAPHLHRCRVVGNGCYWPTSAWLAFTHGSDTLSKQSDLCSEFAEQLDLHAMGVLALQIVAEVLPASTISERQGDATIHCSAVVSKLLSLQHTWRNYWHTTSSAWRRIIRTSTNDREQFENLRSSLQRLGMHKIVQKDLKRLLKILVETSEACRALPQHHVLAEAPALFDAIALMISSGEKPLVSPSWRKIKDLVGDSIAQPSPQIRGQKTSARLRKDAYVKPPSPATDSTGSPSASLALSSTPSDVSVTAHKPQYKWTSSRGALLVDKALWLECDPCS